MDVGFTGSRNGPTPESEAKFRQVMSLLRPTVFRHGGCKGWDAAAVRIVREMFPACRIVCYPGRGAKDATPDRPDRDADAVAASDEVRPEQTHFARNRAIVDDSLGVVGCPPTVEWMERGGTWYTLGYADGKGKLGGIVAPDGSVRDALKEPHCEC